MATNKTMTVDSTATGNPWRLDIDQSGTFTVATGGKYTDRDLVIKVPAANIGANIVTKTTGSDDDIWLVSQGYVSEDLALNQIVDIKNMLRVDNINTNGRLYVTENTGAIDIADNDGDTIITNNTGSISLFNAGGENTGTVDIGHIITIGEGYKTVLGGTTVVDASGNIKYASMSYTMTPTGSNADLSTTDNGVQVSISQTDGTFTAGVLNAKTRITHTLNSSYISGVHVKRGSSASRTFRIYLPTNSGDDKVDFLFTVATNGNVTIS